MRKKIEWEREPLDEYSWRVKVIGGWLVYTLVTSNKGGASIHSTFVADRDHEWIIVAKMVEKEKPPIQSVARDFEPSKD